MVFVAPQVADGASDLIGVDPSQGQLVAALATAIAAALAHRRLRPRVERSINPGRATLDLGIVSLLDELEGCVDLADLMQVIGLRLHDLLAAEAIVIYGRVDGAYAPFYVEGRAVPPAFEATSPLIAALSERDGALTLAVLGRVPEDVGLSPFDRAALETLDAAVILPLQTEEMLVAFLCLGARGNGDVYTHLDVRRLEQLSDRVRQKLAGFGADNVRREGHALQEALRSYVPGVVADAIATGRDVTPGECEVSVLFVDLAGYTRYSESLPASEIFTTINRYTRAVSEIVANHGGTVVEFCGDGLMAVFGAPTQLKGKEREAVAAALEMVSNVAGLGLEQPRGKGSDPAPMTLGVGIATGEVYVGNLKAIDRLIWSAIGNTTILAARLQVLTRDLRASIVVDPTTWERATPEVQDFTCRERTPIRGRTDPVDVYALSTAQAGPPVPNPGT
jgi:class 3 adenylate cyclase